MPEDIIRPEGGNRSKVLAEDVHYGPFGEKHPTAASAEQTRKDSIKNPRTYPGPLGESYSTREEAEQAQQRHVSQMMGDKHARQAEKDSLMLGDRSRTLERQRLSEDLIITPKKSTKEIV